jgi:hypothetical protein
MRPLTSRLALFAVAVVLLAGMGVAHGLLTYRWSPSDAFVPLDQLPFTIGDWDGTAVDIGEALPDLQPGPVLLRRYVNRVNGDALTLYLTAGPTADVLSIHPPDVCYPAAGFRRADPIVTKNVVTEQGPRANQFRVGDYRKTERASPLRLRVFWGWCGGGAWYASGDMRLPFAGRRHIYKMYVIRTLRKDGEPLDEDPALSFLQALIPALGGHVMNKDGQLTVTEGCRPVRVQRAGRPVYPPEC